MQCSRRIMYIVHCTFIGRGKRKVRYGGAVRALTIPNGFGWVPSFVSYSVATFVNSIH